ncbi:DUF1990 domain-containing protein [Phycicoccus sp. SLBN-51]|uniref:DUF1990 family protein n=1 Tax=Phycicoccus sp. SLBN-51 TaxID=2768447 RepID=UPI00114F9DE3|nr:DUF1990 domain-containing protein [Phycicoccus sp. SLBN-51]TQJ52115.1 uncharacterized protein (UPF0548 family) [Phycicoccus sp. SLBN-51]
MKHRRDVQPLSASRLEELQAAPLTYAAVGATASTLPPGYACVHLSRALQRRDFDSAVEDLLAWQVHQRAGLGVAASGSALPGTVVDMRLGLGVLAVRIPCRVVYVVDEPDRRGFAYGTLPGHPESGEEVFLLHRHPDGHVEFTITAFSRPATLLARAGGPVARWVQIAMTRRYLAAPDQLAR